MKIVISRKGFDSKNGASPSPILPDGRALSLPIPVRDAPTRFSQIRYAQGDLGQLASDLTRGVVSPDRMAHLDPDLCFESLDRAPGWLPAFGQSGTAQSHLNSHQVGLGDLFLFFGWFREVQRNKGQWKYRRGEPGKHVLFGWLQVAEVLRVGAETDKFRRSHVWLSSHPHLHGEKSERNTIYLSAPTLSIPGVKGYIPGGGSFNRVTARHVLTAPWQTNRSLWHLPDCFEPRGRTPLSYHSSSSRWSKTSDGKLQMQSVAIGQEFVLDTADYPDVLEWVASLFEEVE